MRKSEWNLAKTINPWGLLYQVHNVKIYAMCIGFLKIFGFIIRVFEYYNLFYQCIEIKIILICVHTYQSITSKI